MVIRGGGGVFLFEFELGNLFSLKWFVCEVDMID